MKIACVVEGHGEVEAVPVLLRRLVAQYAEDRPCEILKPFRVPRGQIVRADDLGRAVDFLARKLDAADLLLVLLDADDDCAAQLAPRLGAYARARRADRRISVVVAVREFESWFLAGAESLRGKRGLPGDLVAPGAPEEIRGAKGWLDDRMPDGYAETESQAALCAIVDLAMVRSRSASFDKLCREIVGAFEEPVTGTSRGRGERT